MVENLIVIGIWLLVIVLMIVVSWDICKMRKQMTPYPDDRKANECIHLIKMANKRFQHYLRKGEVPEKDELQKLFYIALGLADQTSMNTEKTQAVFRSYVKVAREIYILWETLPQASYRNEFDMYVTVNRTKYVLGSLIGELQLQMKLKEETLNDNKWYVA